MARLTEALEHVLADRLRRRSLFVWYDPGGSLEALAEQAVPSETQLVRYGGSYLTLRATLERADPKLEGRWVVYVGTDRLEPSWLRDLELAGTHQVLDLSRLVSRAFSLSLAADIRRGLEGAAGPRLAARWDELVPADPSPSDVRRGLLAAALGLPGSELRDVVLAYVSQGQAPAAVSQFGLQATLRSLLEEAGLSGLPRGEVPPQRVAAALLLSEAVAEKGLEETPFREALPTSAERPRWAAWAREWMERADADPFLRWSKEIETSFRVAGHLRGVKAASVRAFSAVDQMLLAEVERLLREGDRAEARRVAEPREGMHWARRADHEGRPLPWTALLASLELLERAEEAGAQILARGRWPLEDLLGAYQQSWWRLDDAYRRLEAGWSRLSDGLREVSALPACRAYGAYLEAVGTVSAAAAEDDWQANSWEPQGEIGRRVLRPGERAAIVLADALRFDLAHFLAELLRARGVSVDAHPTLAALPSVTQVGMAALMAAGSRQPVVDGGKLFPRVGELVLRRRQERLAALRRLFPTAEDVELDVVLASRPLPAGRPLVVYASAVDEQGDALPQVGLDLFERLVREIGRAVELLLDAGCDPVVVVADHGFVLVPRDVEPRRIELRGDGSLARARRYVVGRPPDVSGAVRVPLARLGWSGEDVALFPRGLAVFSLPGEVPRFFHGGPMPQEVALLTLVCSRPTPLGAPVLVRLVEPTAIDTLLPRFVLEGEPAEELLTQARKVRVVVRLEERVVGESEAVEVSPGGRTDVAVRLGRYGPHVQVLVEDVETREVLVDVSLPVTLPPGYEDLGI